MPIYEYACESCESAFEKLVKLSDPVPNCPECGSSEVRKKVSASGFVLKGSGWYKDHYGLKSSSKSDGSAKKDAGSSPKKASKTKTSKKGGSDA